MDDFIFREAAKAVLENRYRIRTHLHDMAAAQQLKIAEWEIADLPAADVRPVVLCRDCVHFSAHSGTGPGYCGFLDIGTSQEAFCSHGEKEE